MKCKWQGEKSLTFSFVSIEGVLLAISPVGSFVSCTGGFTEVSQDGEVSLGTGAATRVVVSIQVSVGEKTKCIVLIVRPKR